MRIYKSDGKVMAELDETIFLCDFSSDSTLQDYKDALIKRISQRFDQAVAEAAFSYMENPKTKC